MPVAATKFSATVEVLLSGDADGDDWAIDFVAGLNDCPNVLLAFLVVR